MQDIEFPESHPPPHRQEKPAWWRTNGWIVVTAFITLAVIGVAVFSASTHRRRGEIPVLPPPRNEAAVNVASPVELSNSFRGIAKSVKPAVVYINVVERAQDSRRAPSFLDPESPSPGNPRRQGGQGSGFIATGDGYILTNNHVVGSAESIEVTLADGRQFKAELIGTDPETDIALIKIKANGLPYAVLGDSDAVQQGDWVLALGSPFGLQQTLTAGIVSAIGREFGGEQQFAKFIQTDASINPGNSGGPLVNMQGEVIGINSWILSPGGVGNVGIGFSISSNLVRTIFEKLASNGKVTRGYLGVVVVPLSATTARMFRLEPGIGVLVQSVAGSESPAARAGLKSGDVITAIDGRPVTAPRELTDVVASTPIGKDVKVDFIRDQQPTSVTVEIAERPTNVTARADSPDDNNSGPSGETRLGVVAQTVTPEMAESMKLTIKSGALVREVVPGTPAQDAGLRHGDVIHRIDSAEVRSAEDLAAAAKTLKAGDEIAIQVERGGQIVFLNVKIE
ncbi:MAG TPA: trypsin-like peptidase domain-containing protein [Blastocatellia bacterium]|nr:trypsin-like peptidase domain-containing protein [Blastocatellia bacterium]